MKLKTSPQRWFLINLNHQWSITSQNFQLSNYILNLLDRVLGLLAKNWVLMFLMSSTGKRCDSVDLQPSPLDPSTLALIGICSLGYPVNVSLTYDRLCVEATMTKDDKPFIQPQFVQNWSWTWSQKLGVSLPMPCLTQNFHLFVSHSCAQNWSPPSKFAELDEWSQKIDLAPSSRTMWCERASPSAMGLHPSFERFPGCFQNHVHMLKWMLAKDTKPLPGISLTQDCQQLVDPAKCLPMLWGRGSLHHQQCALLGLINAAV